MTPPWVALRPPPVLKLSEYADEHYVMSASSSASPGKWKTRPYQRGPLDAMSDPDVERVTVKKSSRLGFTLGYGAAICYYIDYDPTSILLGQPTDGEARTYSKDFLDPMIEDNPRVAAKMPKPRRGDKDATILRKAFPGGKLELVSANSPTGLRMKSCRVVILDEIDAYPPSAGKEGDPVKLAEKRSQEFWNRKIILGSSPTIKGLSHIDAAYEDGDQRRRYWPCPQCGHMDYLAPRQTSEGGHCLHWTPGKPEDAHFVCSKNGCIIEEKDKLWMDEHGEDRAAKEFKGHASFSLWVAYADSPNATWAGIAKEWEEAKGKPEREKVVYNTTFGESYAEIGEAPEWRRLYERRKQTQGGIVPRKSVVLVGGIDVQANRLEYEIVSYAVDKQSWSIEPGVIMGDTAHEEVWREADKLVNRTWPNEDGNEIHVRLIFVDAGFQTSMVYEWARRHPGRVVAILGRDYLDSMVGPWRGIQYTYAGKRIRRGAGYRGVGVNIVKEELYGQLRLDAPTKESGGEYPPGYCHFGEHNDEEYFRQLCSEHLVETKNAKGFPVRAWHRIAGQPNHGLDRRVYARAAAYALGLDRMARSPRPPPKPKPAAPNMEGAPPPPVAATEQQPRKQRTRGDGWFAQRRAMKRERRGDGWRD